MPQEPKPTSETKRKRYSSAFRKRRRANKLPASELRGVQADFEFRRSSRDTADAHLLSRPEVVDAVLIGVGANIRFLSDQINHIRRQMGIATTSTGGPFLLEKGDAPTVRTFVQERRKSA